MKLKNNCRYRLNWKTILFLIFWVQMTSIPVFAAPEIISVNPTSIGQGVSGKLMAIYGTGFQCGMIASFSSNPTVNPTVTTSNDAPANQFVNQCPNFSLTSPTYTTVPSNVKFFSDSNVYLYINVPASFPNSLVTMTFTNPDSTSGTFDLKINPAPTISSAATNPSSVTVGSSFDLTLNGTGFQNGAFLTFSQAGILASSFSVDPSGLQATAHITISETAVPESAIVTLTNPDGGSASRSSAFLILPLLGEKTPLLTVYEDPRLVNGGYATFHRFWNGEWSNEGTLSSPVTGGNRLDAVVKPHPFLFQQMMGDMVYSNTEFQVWDQGGWGHPIVVNKSASVFGRGTFDVAYESKSGNGLAVYGTISVNGGIYYRRFFQTGSASSNCDSTLAGNSAPPCWGPETLMPSPGFASGKYLWKVKLIANPDKTKNEILVVYEDNTQCNVGNTLCSSLFVRQWDGSSGTFSSAVLISNLIPIASTVSWAYDAVYTGASLQPIVSWFEVVNGRPKSCKWNGTACPISGTPLQSGTAANSTLYQLQLSADPFTDQVALGTRQVQGTNGILKVQIGDWDGTNLTWPSSSYPTDEKGLYTMSSTLAAATSRSDLSFNFIWKKGSPFSSLFGIYTDAGGGLNYQIWTPDLLWSGDTTIPGLPTQNPLVSFVSPFVLDSIQFDSDPRTGDIFGAMKTSDSLFSSIRWDGDTATWVDYQQLSAGEYLSLFKDPFSVSYFKSFPTLFAATSQFLFTQGDTNITISVNGTLIQDGATLSFPGFAAQGQTVSHSVGSDQIVSTGSISSTIAPGVYDVTVTNPDRSLVVGKGYINILPAPGNPVIYSVYPSSRGQGSKDQTVLLSGYNLPSAGYSISFSGNGTDITIKHQQILNASQISIQLDIDPNAPAGPRTVILTDTLSNQSSFSGLFTVNYGPTITGVSPASIFQGTTQSGILVSGNDFQAGADMILSDGAFSLGWDLPGTIPSTLYKNKMTGNRFYVDPGSTTSFAVLDSILVKAVLVGPAKKLNGQVAIYDDTGAGGLPGNLKATTGIQALTSAGSGLNTFRFNLSSPVFLQTPANYWVLINVEGEQTIIPYTEGVPNCNGDTSFNCTAVSKSELFGTWPNPAGPFSANEQIPNRKLAMVLGYYPVIGTNQNGTSSLGSGQYQNQMTGSEFTLYATTKVPFLYAYTDSVDSTNPSAQMRIYDKAGSGGSPGNLLTGARNIFNNHLTPKSFNIFPIPRYGGVDFSLTGSAGGSTYWAVTNVNGATTTLTYDDPFPGVSSVQSGQAYGTWPDPFPASSTLSNRRYSFFAVKSLVASGNTTATSTDGPDSNQMTGTKFTATTATNLVGISLFVDWVDPANPLGSVAIYPDIGGVPSGTASITTTPQILQAHNFNTFTIPITTLSAGSYWLMANLAGRGTTLSYDEGTSNDSVKSPYLFSSGWPNASLATWTSIPQRRYAIRVVPDVMISSSNALTGKLITGTVTVDPNAVTVPRSICVINPDGGQICQAFDPSNLPLFEVIQGIRSTPAMVSYGVTSSSYPVSRKWNGYAPWSVESASPISAGGGSLWSVLRALTSSGVATTRVQEKILGTVSSAPLLALQVWNGSTSSWGNSFNLIPSATGSRSFDIAYETLTGRGIVVYGLSGNAVPQYRIWNGSSWSAAQGVGASNTTGSTVLWVRLEPNPKTNEMILAYLSGSLSGGAMTSATLHTLVWNGTSFGNEKSYPVFDPLDDNINLCKSCAPPITGQSFDIAYEHVSGRALLAWGAWGNSTPLYVIWNGTQWSASSLGANPASSSPVTPLIYFKMAGDPNSNQIAMGTATIDGQSFDVQIWDGISSWGAGSQNMLYDTANNLSFNLLFKMTSGSSTSSDPNFNPGRNFDLAWEKDSGKLVTVFGSSHSVNACEFSGGSSFPYSTRYRIWDPAKGWTSDILLPNIGKDIVPRSIQLVSDTSSNDLFLDVTGQSVTTYSNNNNFPDTATCIVAEDSATHLSDLRITNQLFYWWHRGAWIYKEVLNNVSSSAIRAVYSGVNYTAYGESVMTAFNRDTIPPSPVSDLTYTGVTNNSVTLQWTSTGEDGSFGWASSYTIGYSTNPIYTDADFATTSVLKVTIPATLPPGYPLPYSESYTVNSPPLNSSTTYCFAVIATDRAGNSSTLSSVNPCTTTASAATSGTGVAAPGAIKDLIVVPGSIFNNATQLTWTAPGSIGYSGTATAYDLRYASTPIVDQTSFDAATPVIAMDGSGRNGVSAPHPAGTREFFTFTGLPSGVTYFAIKACGPLALNPLTLRCDSILSPLNVSLLDINNARNLNSVSPCQALNSSSNSPVCVNNGNSSVTNPSSITDLVVTSVTSNTMTLRWTAPMNTADGSMYDLRVSTGSITSQNFDSLNKVKGVPSPFPGGTVQSFAVTNLLSNSTSGVTYHFAIKTANSNGLVSTLSNIASGTTRSVYDISPPSPILDLSIVQKGINHHSVTLSWTATGDDGTEGTAMQYDIRYSNAPILSLPAFQAASRALDSPFPMPSGNKEIFTVTGLDSNTVYYFAVKAIDKGSNASGLSSCVTLLPDDTAIPSDCSGHTALHSGYNLVSVPYRLSGKDDPETVFGGDVGKPVTIYQWEFGSYSVPSMITEATGYFLYAAANSAVLSATDPSGKLIKNIETAATAVLPLQTGWNIIGNPYLLPVLLKDTCISNGTGLPIPFASAVINGWIGNSVYSFDGIQYHSDVYDDPLGISPPASLNSWNGYWLQVMAGGSNYSLVIPNTPGGCP